MRNLKRSYLKWLSDIVDSQHGASYFKLCKVLYERDFVWSVSNDDNRCQDGMDLRERYLDVHKGAETPDKIDQFLEEDCTVLEVLVGVAKRMDFIMYDPQRGEVTPKWFNILLCNLKLDSFTDDYTRSDEFPRETVAEIDHILDIWLNRKYDRYGNGSLFPIKGDCPRDMRRTEIWYQMMAFIEENYEI